MEPVKHSIHKDLWQSLRNFTAARIALGRTGVSIPSRDNLECKMAHALARDAVYTPLEKEKMIRGIEAMGHQYFLLHSKAIDRQQYLQRPDLGRRLDEPSIEKIKTNNEKYYSVCINIADGLSATAVNSHALPFLQLLLPLLREAGLSVAPICIIQEGRVAISDETGDYLHAKLSVILIGERPGLSSPDSLGVYLTYHPLIGNTDAMRNCISNIRPGGLSYQLAVEKTVSLIKESLRLGLSGVQLKDMGGLLNT